MSTNDSPEGEKIINQIIENRNQRHISKEIPCHDENEHQLIHLNNIKSFINDLKTSEIEISPDLYKSNNKILSNFFFSGIHINTNQR